MTIPEDRFQKHLEINRRSWDAYQRVWADATARKHAGGSTPPDECLDPLEIEMIGDVRGLDVLELSCAWDAGQAFALARLGATVTACDFSPAAIDIAKRRARERDLPVEFALCDSQTLEPMADESFDLVFAQYNHCYYEDLPRAFASWHRVLRPGGRLFVREAHPFTAGLEVTDGSLTITRSYFEKNPEHYLFDGTGEIAGYRSDLPAVEFPHTLADFVNAMAQAGFRIDRMVETEQWEHRVLLPGLPMEMFMTATRTRHVGPSESTG